MLQLAPHFAHIGAVRAAAALGPVKADGKAKLTDAPFEKAVLNFYMTDPISRASTTMAECTRAVREERGRKAA